MIPHSRPTLGTEEKRALEEVLESGEIAQGRRVREFEKNFCALLGRRYAVAVSSGTSALHLSLLALEIGRGDEVILPSYTCAALLHAVAAAGARPVVVDIDPEDFNLSMRETRKKIRRRTRAVIIPHAFGRAAAIEELSDAKIAVIEDGTQALGAKVGDCRVGSFGRASVFSFYATKMITTGEGGMVLTNSRRVAQRLQDLRDYDKREKYDFRTNSKMTDLEAAMGIVQLGKLPAFIQRRREIASRYTAALQGSGVLAPAADSRRDPVYYRYVVRVTKKPKDWLRQVRNCGIDAKEPVFKPLHRYLNLPDSQFPETTRAMKESCSLPIYPTLSEEACREVLAAISGRGSPRYAEV